MSTVDSTVESTLDRGRDSEKWPKTMEGAASQPVVSFKRKRKGGRGRRNRAQAVLVAEDAPVVAEGAAGAADEDVVDDAITLVRRDAKRTKRSHGFKTAGAGRTSGRVAEASGIASTREAAQFQYRGGAFESIETETSADRDNRAVKERNLALNETMQGDGDASAAGAKVYRGEAGYKNYIAKSKEKLAAGKFSGTQGPIRAPTFVRTSARFDYQPDICKDFKETGYCGYGDACIYMHDRTDYKSGWQIEQEYATLQKRRAKRLAAGLNPDAASSGEEEEEGGDALLADAAGLPFACFLCRTNWGDLEAGNRPVVTQCRHYFCERCALRRMRTTPKCGACDAQTRGIFNNAKKIIAKLSKAAGTKAGGPGGGANSSSGGGGGGGWVTVPTPAPTEQV